MVFEQPLSLVLFLLSCHCFLFISLYLDLTRKHLSSNTMSILSLFMADFAIMSAASSSISASITQSYSDDSTLVITNDKLDGHNMFWWSFVAAKRLVTLRRSSASSYPTSKTWELNNSIIMVSLISSLCWDINLSPTYEDETWVA